MGEHRRKADGRRVFSTEFKRETVQRIVTGEKTVAELSRELDISPSVIRNGKRFADGGATTAVLGPSASMSSRWSLSLPGVGHAPSSPRPPPVELPFESHSHFARAAISP